MVCESEILGLDVGCLFGSRCWVLWQMRDNCEKEWILGLGISLHMGCTQFNMCVVLSHMILWGKVSWLSHMLVRVWRSWDPSKIQGCLWQLLLDRILNRLKSRFTYWLCLCSLRDFYWVC